MWYVFVETYRIEHKRERERERELQAALTTFSPDRWLERNDNLILCHNNKK
jgi:hypothetical protein